MNKEDRALYEELMSEVSKKVTETLDKAFPDVDDNSKTFLELFDEQFDINSIPYEQRKKQYVDYQIFFDYNVHLGTIEPLLNVNEGYMVNPKDIHPAKDLDELVKFLNDAYQIENWQINLIDRFGTGSLNTVVRTKKYLPTEFGILIPQIKNNIRIIEYELKEFGYYLFDTKEYTDENDMSWLIANFNPLVQPNCNDYLRDSLSSTIIHCSPSFIRDSIKKNGFQPRYEHDSAYYPPKLFFIINKKLVKNNIKMLNNTLKRHNCKTLDVYIFNIDDVVDDFTFYRDTNAPECCYTKETIPYEYVHKVIYDVVPDKYNEYKY